MYVKVPEPLAESLAADGFRVAGPERGIELYAETFLAASANLVTILVARHEISRFVAHVWACARRRAPAQRHSLTVVLEQDDRRLAITLEHEGFGDDAPPQAAVRGLAALVEALAEPDEDPPLRVH
jgi:hypothetical protein